MQITLYIKKLLIYKNMLTPSWRNSIQETASIFWINISFGSEIKIDDKNITIPNNYKNLDDRIWVWFCLILSWMILSNDTNIEQNMILNDFENNEISQISKMIFASFVISKRYLLTNTFKYTDLFFNSLNVKLKISNNKLFMYLWEIIQDIDSFWNKPIQEIYDKISLWYLNYKASLIEEESCNWSCNKDNDWRWDTDELIQQDIEFWEQAEWQDVWVYAYFEPKLKWKFLFSSWVYEKFNLQNKRFEKADKNKIKVNPSKEDIVSTLHYTANNPQKLYTISLPKWYKVVDFDTQKLEVFVDNYGQYTFKAKTPWEHKFGIEYTEENIFETDSSLENIYTWNIIPNIWENPFEILSWIQTKKKYKETNQKKLLDISKDTNSYIENIYLAEEIECMTSNMFFVAMCRRIWYKARLIAWISSYHKTEKSYLSNNRWHAWSEVYINWKWIELDATPIKKDNEDNKSCESSWESIEEMINNIWDEDENNNKSEPKKNTEEKQNQANYWQTKQQEEIRKWIADILDLSQNIDTITKSAIDFVYKDAQEIVQYIKYIEKLRQENEVKRKIWIKNTRTKRWLTNGNMVIDSDTIQRLSVWDPRVFEKKVKPQTNPENDTDTSLSKVSIAIDISGSMGKINWNWEVPQKMESAFLSIVLLSLICKELKIDLNIVLFSNESFVINEKFLSWNNLNLKFYNEIIEIISSRSFWNNANASWVHSMLQSLVLEKKWVWIIFSDWDGNSNAFFTDVWESRKIIKDNNLVVLWYWLWEDASASAWMNNWEILTVIEKQLDTWDFSKTRWYPLIKYQEVVKKLREDLASIMTQKKVKLK